jgi:hypothetical protein
MYKVKDVAELTHLTSRQVYDRLTALSPVLNGSLKTGSRGAKLLTSEGFAVFQRLVDLEGEGHSRESAIEVIREDLKSTDTVKTEAARNDREPSGKLVETLERVIEDQRAEIAHLRSQVDRLMPLALPAPRRWLGLFRRRREGTPV